jgi:hypothetical protein
MFLFSQWQYAARTHGTTKNVIAYSSNAGYAHLGSFHTSERRGGVERRQSESKGAEVCRD